MTSRTECLRSVHGYPQTVHVSAPSLLPISPRLGRSKSADCLGLPEDWIEEHCSRTWNINSAEHNGRSFILQHGHGSKISPLFSPLTISQFAPPLSHSLLSPGSPIGLQLKYTLLVLIQRSQKCGKKSSTWNWGAALLCFPPLCSSLLFLSGGFHLCSSRSWCIFSASYSFRCCCASSCLLGFFFLQTFYMYYF